MDWFLYDNGPHHERVKEIAFPFSSSPMNREQKTQKENIEKKEKDILKLLVPIEIFVSQNKKKSKTLPILIILEICFISEGLTIRL